MAALTAAVMAALALPAGSAFADDSYLISPSGYLQDRTGTLTMTVSGEREVQVKIEKDTPDGIILYYDTTERMSSCWTAANTTSAPASMILPLQSRYRTSRTAWRAIPRKIWWS